MSQNRKQCFVRINQISKEPPPFKTIEFEKNALMKAKSFSELPFQNQKKSFYEVNRKLEKIIRENLHTSHFNIEINTLIESAKNFNLRELMNIRYTNKLQLIFNQLSPDRQERIIIQKQLARIMNLLSNTLNNTRKYINLKEKINH